MGGIVISNGSISFIGGSSNLDFSPMSFNGKYVAQHTVVTTKDQSCGNNIVRCRHLSRRDRDALEPFGKLTGRRRSQPILDISKKGLGEKSSLSERESYVFALKRLVNSRPGAMVKSAEGKLEPIEYVFHQEAKFLDKAKQKETKEKRMREHFQHRVDNIGIRELNNRIDRAEPRTLLEKMSSPLSEQFARFGSLTPPTPVASSPAPVASSPAPVASSAVPV